MLASAAGSVRSFVSLEVDVCPGHLERFAERHPGEPRTATRPPVGSFRSATARSLRAGSRDSFSSLIPSHRDASATLWVGVASPQARPRAKAEAVEDVQGLLPRVAGRVEIAGGALMLLGVQTGLRVSELAALRGEDVTMGAGAHVRCYGKGRKERCTPLSRETADVVRAWMRTRDGRPQDPLFPSRGSLRCLSRSAIGRLVAKHASAASDRCPSLADKRPTPHTLRHTCDMRLLESGVDPPTIAL